MGIYGLTYSLYHPEGTLVGEGFNVERLIIVHYSFQNHPIAPAQLLLQILRRYILNFNAGL